MEQVPVYAFMQYAVGTDLSVISPRKGTRAALEAINQTPIEETEELVSPSLLDDGFYWPLTQKLVRHMAALALRGEVLGKEALSREVAPHLAMWPPTSIGEERARIAAGLLKAAPDIDEVYKWAAWIREGHV